MGPLIRVKEVHPLGATDCRRGLASCTTTERRALRTLHKQVVVMIAVYRRKGARWPDPHVAPLELGVLAAEKGVLQSWCLLVQLGDL